MNKKTRYWVIAFGILFCVFLYFLCRPSAPDEVVPTASNLLPTPQQEITKGNIKGFISEAALFVEYLEFADKLSYLAVAGTQDSRPDIDPRGLKAIQELQKLDIAMLHAPIIGGEIFIKDMPWAKDEHYSVEKRQNRFGTFSRKYGHPQKTIEPLKNMVHPVNEYP